MTCWKSENTAREMKKNILWVISRLDIAEGRISKSVNLKIGQKKLSN